MTGHARVSILSKAENLQKVMFYKSSQEIYHLLQAVGNALVRGMSTTEKFRGGTPM